MSAAALLLLAAVLMAVFMTAVFVVAQRIHNAGLVDVAWSFGFTILAAVYAWLADGAPARRGLIAGMFALWSLRLALHLHRRVMGDHPREDGRYLELRRRWGAGAALRFFVFFQAQGLLVVLLSTPMLVAALDARHDLGALELTALAVWLVALGGEALADDQLRRFKADPAHRGRTCRSGLWRYSRHPNYFFEWLVWVAFWLFALASPWGWLTAYCPLLMLFFLFRVTGIPATEVQALRSRGAEYREYQRTTSVFVPWLPRGGSAGTAGS
jgi:steroid 5-alpha reductase family enzyme